VDNLAKFVLDSLNGLLYDDDRQVCSLHATRLLDNDGLCLGSTEVCVRAVGDADLPRLLNGSFHPP
jgi:Holliday junction resolvase RusA-like endonuclease